MVYTFPLTDGTGIVREFQRGGFIRHFLQKSYFNDNRPDRELRVWCHARDAKISVPEPLGVCWVKRGPFYSGSIATRFVDSVHLQSFLESKPEEAHSDLVLNQLGKNIREMHAANIIHADLQVRNLLVEANGGTQIIDFDNARIATPIRDSDRYRNLLRLKRSFEKNGLDLKYFTRLCDGYGLEQFPETLEALYAIKGKASSTIARSNSSTDKP